MIFYDNLHRTMFEIYNYTSTLAKINIIFIKDIFVAVFIVK